MKTQNLSNCVYALSNRDKCQDRKNSRRFSQSKTRKSESFSNKDYEKFIERNLIENNLLLDLSEESKSKKSTDFELSQEKRKDYTNLLTFTIDQENSKILDDAFSVRTTKNGYELFIHISDVVSYVPFNESLINSEAKKRGESIYLPGRVLPMLPLALQKKCSLEVGQKKPCTTVRVNLTKNAKVQNYEVVKSFIKSDCKCSYNDVDNILNGTASDDITKKYSNLIDSLTILSIISLKLKNNKALVSNGLFSRKRKLDIQIINGKIFSRFRYVEASNDMVEEILSICNFVMKLYFQKLGLPFLSKNVDKYLACNIQNSNSSNYRKYNLLDEDINNTDTIDDISSSDICLFNKPIRNYACLRNHQILSMKLRGVPSNELHALFDESLLDLSKTLTTNHKRISHLINVCTDYCSRKSLESDPNKKYTGCIHSRNKNRNIFVNVDGFDKRILCDKKKRFFPGEIVTFNVRRTSNGSLLAVNIKHISKQRTDGDWFYMNDHHLKGCA